MATEGGRDEARAGVPRRWSARQWGYRVELSARNGHLTIRTRGPVLLTLPFLLMIAMGLGLASAPGPSSGPTNLRVGLALAAAVILGLAFTWSFVGPRILELDRGTGQATLRRPPWPSRRWPLAGLRQVRWRWAWRAGWLFALDAEGQQVRVSAWLDFDEPCALAEQAARTATDLLTER